jgi:hypothetical protein
MRIISVFFATAINYVHSLSSRCDTSFGMMAEEVIPPLLSVEAANAPDEPDTGCVENQEEQMGIFQTLDRLEEAVDALLNAKSSVSSSTLQHHLKVQNTKKLINCTLCTKSFAKLGDPCVQKALEGLATCRDI